VIRGVRQRIVQRLFSPPLTGISYRALAAGQPQLAAGTRAARRIIAPWALTIYKVVLYRQDDGSWVAEIPALGGCYALMDTREAALAELQHVFDLIAQEHEDRGQALPKDTTEIVRA
jgi:predicted RNase H-like HicB family nuclease